MEENSINANIRIPGYKIVKQLGTGGMGTVYEAISEKDGKKYAIKVCHPHLSSIREFKKRFQREASLALKFNHPGAAAIYDNGETPEGVSYIIMELVEGEKLTDLLPRRPEDAKIAQQTLTGEKTHPRIEGPIPVKTAILITRQI
ncbi:protein kinase, partial [Candidatus Sumerlaeota bacterium]|nr:protein kinase [Candidatus Sumerlaeota bacterium]